MKQEETDKHLSEKMSRYETFVNEVLKRDLRSACDWVSDNRFIYGSFAVAEGEYR